MGIKNLHKLFDKYCPQIYTTVDLKIFAYKRIAIDISLYLFKYKTIFGDSWLSAFVNLITCLRKNDIHCIFIYDGKSPPEKQQEKDSRKSSREALENKMISLEDSLELFYNTNEIDENLKNICNKPSHRLLKDLQETVFDISLAEKELKKVKSQIVNISSEDISLTKTLFNLMEIPFFEADGEAETLCAHLAISGIIDGVLSEDTDVLAYGTKIFLTKINVSSGTCVVLLLDEILKELEISYKQFLDICVMCGNDYNKNIPRIGFVNSFNLIKEHECIENISKNTQFDTQVLNYERTRELFTLPEKVLEKFEYVKNCGKPNFENLMKFLYENNCHVNFQNMKKAFQSRELTFSDDAE
jgi:5'-3' exonuclease